MIDGLVNQVQRAYAREGRLFQVQIDLLYQCDLDCEHCYLDDKKRRILSTAFWRGVLDQLAEMQVFTVMFSGGELFLRKDALDIIAYARRLGFFVQVRTHGARLSEPDIERMRDLGVNLVYVSYYSTDPAIHDAITRREGSQQATLRTLRWLADHGVPTIAQVPLMKRNARCYPAILEQLGPLGIYVQVDGTMKPANSGDLFPQDLTLAHEDLVELHRFQQAADGECGVATPGNDWGSRRICVAGHEILYIDAEGKVTPCVSWPMPIADLGAGDRLADLWTDSPALTRIRGYRNASRDTCSTCGVKASCSYCPGEAWLASGDELGGSDSMCRTASAKAHASASPGAEVPVPARLGSGRPRFRILSNQAAQLAKAEVG